MRLFGFIPGKRQRRSLVLILCERVLHLLIFHGLLGSDCMHLWLLLINEFLLLALRVAVAFVALVVVVWLLLLLQLLVGLVIDADAFLTLNLSSVVP